MKFRTEADECDGTISAGTRDISHGLLSAQCVKVLEKNFRCGIIRVVYMEQEDGIAFHSAFMGQAGLFFHGLIFRRKKKES